MKHPFFSIVIPTYNQSNYLKTALTSIFKQKFKNYEVIVVDNHSKDETYKVVKNFKKKIIYKKIRNNGVIAKSRNLGIKLSKGKWIAFLDSDDYWTVDKLEKNFQIINSKDCDVVCNSEWIINLERKTKKVWCNGPYSKNFYKKLLKFGNRNSTSASIIKKDFINKFNINFDERRSFITCEDYDFFLNIAKKGGKFHYTNEPLGVHIFHKESASSDKTFHLNSINAVIKYHVFKVQKFSKQKQKLWKSINDIKKLKKVVFNIKKINKNYSYLFEFFDFFLYKPVQTLKFILFLIYKYLIQSLIYYIYMFKKI